MGVINKLFRKKRIAANKKSTTFKQKKNVRQAVIKNDELPKSLPLEMLIGDALWLIALLMVFYFMLCLFSFSVDDLAWSRSTSVETHARNLGGTIGAYISDIAYYVAGFSIWWGIFATFVCLFKSFRSRNNRKISERYSYLLGITGIVLLISSSAIIEHFILSEKYAEILPVGAGGIIGMVLANYMKILLGQEFSIILSVGMMLIGISLILQVSLFSILEKVGNFLELNLRFLIRRIQKIISIRPGRYKERISRRMVKKFNEEEKTLDIYTEIHKQQKTNTQSATTKSSRGRKNNDTPLFNGVFNELPSLDLLKSTTSVPMKVDPVQLQNIAEVIENKFAEFDVSLKVVSAVAGPVITRFEIEPAQGVKGSKILSLRQDIARSLSLESLRIVENIAGRNTMGIEIPNDERQNIFLREIIESSIFIESKSPLTIALGKDITGTPVVADLSRMPHLLVAGTTGSGKSVCINTIILSMLYKSTADNLRLILIDPKITEFSPYHDIPHLLCPVITEMQQVLPALKWCVNEMEKRYKLLSHLEVRNIFGLNEKIVEAEKQKITIPDPFSPDLDNPIPLKKLPYIVIFVDEFADLILTYGKEVEPQIQRLVQKARAAGIHLVLATQRPEASVVTGVIKANVPARIALKVSNSTDSRIVLDSVGAENLLGNGDMLVISSNNQPVRLHGAFVSDSEVVNIANYLRKSGPSRYVNGVLENNAESDNNENNIGNSNNNISSELFDQAVQVILKNRKVSISSLQRHLRIGYNRAANLVDELEKAGIISEPDAGNNRKILI
ncbi:MAG: DNA translocase FtsK 4TM domain-containing protein [Neisseriaceae bacterium]|nr:DNA translocase FtsK 4TM domain-containing protein [Neisseriaceae bacterium]